MSEKIQSQLGRRLREAREQRGISVSQAAAETRILQRYLLALEEGAYHHLPGDVYARGFIRNYAQYLELPPEEMVEVYRAERGGSAPIRIMPAATPPRTRSCLAPSVFIVFFLVAILAVTGYLVANALGLTRNDLVVAPTMTTAIATPQPFPTATIQPTSVAAEATPAPTAAVTSTQTLPNQTPEATPAAPLVVEVTVLRSQSWMLVVVDGVTRVEGLRNGGWNERFTAEREVRVRAGNAGVVQVSVNGGQPTIMGAIGQVRDQRFQP